MHPLFRTRYRHGLLAILALSALLAAGPSAAQSPCTCRAVGASFDLGACACLNTRAGPRMACCGKVLNNTAWRFTDRLCPSARAPAFDTVGLPPVPRPATGPQPAAPWRSAIMAEQRHAQ